MTELGDKSWDLSLYELHRTSHEAITDNTEIAVSPKVDRSHPEIGSNHFVFILQSLQSELTCPICLDMLTSTMTTKECLHRFCAECIITALRSGNKECPTCRKKLVSKRSLRPDPNFDQLVAKIFPDREEYEEQQEKVGFELEITFLNDIFSAGSRHFVKEPQPAADVYNWRCHKSPGSTCENDQQKEESLRL